MENKKESKFPNKLEKILMTGGILISLGSLYLSLSDPTYKEPSFITGMSGLLFSTLIMGQSLGRYLYRNYKLKI